LPPRTLTRLSKPPLLVPLVKRKPVRAEPRRQVAGVAVIVTAVVVAATSAVVTVAVVAVAAEVPAVVIVEAAVTAVDNCLVGV
jgi:hypothetical protein